MKYITANEASKQLGHHRNYVATLIRDGKIPGKKAIVENRLQWVVRVDLLERFKKQREAAAEPVEPQTIDGFGEVRKPLRGEADSVLPGSLWWLT